MIHELRTYTIQPGKQGEYLRLNLEVGRKIRGNDYGVLDASWTSEFGLLNQYVHLWRYPSLDERDRLRGALQKNEAWSRDYVAQIRPLLVAQQNKFLSPVLSFTPPTGGGHVYELRTYRAHVGKLGEWLSLFKGIMPVREKYSKNVGVWQTEAGTLNEAVHLWAYRDLNDRAAVRARVLDDPDWQAFLVKAMPLLAEMHSVVLMPAPSSPIK